jgi:hypothetical protein
MGLRQANASLPSTCAIADRVYLAANTQAPVVSNYTFVATASGIIAITSDYLPAKIIKADSNYTFLSSLVVVDSWMHGPAAVVAIETSWHFRQTNLRTVDIGTWVSSIKTLPSMFQNISKLSFLRGSNMLVATLGNLVVAISADDSAIVWQYDALSPIISIAASSDGLILTALTASNVIALSAVSGLIVWSAPVSAASDMLFSLGYPVLVSTLMGPTLLLDKQSGLVLAQIDVNPCRDLMALTSNCSLVCLASRSVVQSLYFAPNNTQQLWQHSVASGVITDLIVGKTTLVISVRLPGASPQVGISVLDLATGRLVWATQLVGEEGFLAVDAAGSIVVSISTGPSTMGFLYVLGL